MKSATMRYFGSGLISQKSETEISDIQVKYLIESVKVRFCDLRKIFQNAIHCYRFNHSNWTTVHTSASSDRFRSCFFCLEDPEKRSLQFHFYPPNDSSGILC